MKVTYYLIITRNNVLIRKRRPDIGPGEWVVRLTVDYPPMPTPADLDVTLSSAPPLGELTTEEVEYEQEPVDGDPAA